MIFKKWKVDIHFDARNFFYFLAKFCKYKIILCLQNWTESWHFCLQIHF